MVIDETEVGSLAIAAPRTVQELGIRRNLVEGLALKTLYLQGELLLDDLADQMRVSMAIVAQILERLRRDQFVEVKGVVAGVQRIAATGPGKERALELLELSHYAGPVPVSLDEYSRQVRAQSIRNVSLQAADVERIFSHLVLRSATVAQLGTAIVSGRSVLLFGPSGVGKTALAKAITGVYSDYVWIPYAIEVGNQVITIYDAYLHDLSDEPINKQADKRWVRCRRPRVVVGGEFKLEIFDLQFNPVGRYYSAPLQMKANNGVLVLDDVGRQQVRPGDLFNRWMLPLDRGIDFLSLVGGRRFSVPFDMFIVIATNLDPMKLMDEAFLRRLEIKVKLDFASPQEYHEIFQRVCDECHLRYDAAVVDELVTSCEQSGRPLRPSDPGEIVKLLRWVARYEGRPARLDSASLSQACRNYFVSA